MEDDRISISLVGKLWLASVPNPNAFVATMKNVWKVKNGVEIRNTGGICSKFNSSIGATNNGF